MKLLINHCLKQHILHLDHRSKERLREKLEYLEAGIWDAGVRVKKLKGLSSKVVFEARLSRGDRILFTIGRQEGNTSVYLWGIVRHDDVRKTAEAIIPENAPFLRFESPETEDMPELLLDEIPETFVTQEAVDEKTPEDYGPQKWLVLEEEDWKRILLEGDPDDFELFLHLTPEQAGVLEADPPILLSGTAGSGKTTLSVYYLLKPWCQGKKRLFLTYHPFLRDFSRRIYKGLVARTDLEQAQPEPEFLVFRELIHGIAHASGMDLDERKEVDLERFKEIFHNHRLNRKYDAELVWEEIRSIIKGAKPSIRLERLRRLCHSCLRGELRPEEAGELREILLGLQSLDFFDKLERVARKRLANHGFMEFVRTLGYGEGKPHQAGCSVLEETLKIVEKRADTLARPLLSYEEYLALGRKRAPNFLYERKEIYDIAAYYQDRLEKEGLWDEIDLCRWALQNLEKNKGTRSGYDLLVCDEVQDFADIQLGLIFRLARFPENVVLTGDPKQIINPSGFRWEEVKDKFYDRGIDVPEVRHLRLNFRCVGSIVRFANALLDLKQELVGLSGAEMREDWKFNGRPPFLLAGMPEKDALERLRHTSAGRVILVRTPTEQRKLKRALKTELVFTIHEAKGLEFDTVFLWKFASEKTAASVWRRIGAQDPTERSHHPHIRHEINLLYVAVTRARNTLILYDPSDHLWSLPRFREFLVRTEDRDMLAEIWQTISTPEEWAQQGNYFFEREYYAAAAECYKNAGDGPRADLALALTLKGKGDVAAAAPLLEKHGRAKEAAACYEEAGRFDRALSLWKAEGDVKRAGICQILLFEQQGKFNRAAEACTVMGDRDRALENWLKANNHGKVAEHFVSVKDPRRAAEAFEQAGNYSMAALNYKKAKDPHKAAQLFFKAGEFQKALPLYKRLKDQDMLIRCYTSLEDFYNAGLLHEKAKDVDRAVDCFARHAKQSKESQDRLMTEADAFATGRTRIKGAIRYAALGMQEKAAPIFLEKGYTQLAIAAFKKAGDPAKAVESLAAKKNYYEAAEGLEAFGAPGWVEQAAGYFRMYMSSSRREYLKRENQLIREAQACLKGNRVEAALARFKAVLDEDGIYRAHRKLGRDEEALQDFLKYEMRGPAEQWLREKGEVAVSVEFLHEAVKNMEGIRRHSRHVETGDILARMLSRYRNKNPGTKIDDLVDRFLEALHGDHLAGEIPSDSVLDLMVKTSHANIFLHSMRSARYYAAYGKNIPKSAQEFLEKARTKAEESGDPVLLACCRHQEKPGADFDLPENLPVTKRNVDLFAAGTRYFDRAVRFYLDAGRIDEAVRTCRRHNALATAARILEDSGDLSGAGRQYRDAGLFEHALRCFQAVDDKVGSARVYERMEDFDKAVSLWEKLGRNRDVVRVRKKIGKKREEQEQLNLF